MTCKRILPRPFSFFVVSFLWGGLSPSLPPRDFFFRLEKLLSIPNCSSPLIQNTLSLRQSRSLPPPTILSRNPWLDPPLTRAPRSLRKLSCPPLLELFLFPLHVIRHCSFSVPPPHTSGPFSALSLPYAYALFAAPLFGTLFPPLPIFPRLFLRHMDPGPKNNYRSSFRPSFTIWVLFPFPGSTHFLFFFRPAFLFLLFFLSLVKSKYLLSAHCRDATGYHQVLPAFAVPFFQGVLTEGRPPPHASSLFFPVLRLFPPLGLPNFAGSPKIIITPPGRPPPLSYSQSAQAPLCTCERWLRSLPPPFFFHRPLPYLEETGLLFFPYFPAWLLFSFNIQFFPFLGTLRYVEVFHARDALLL